jgi:hypothetical protein
MTAALQGNRCAQHQPVGRHTRRDQRRELLERRLVKDYFLRWRIFARMRRFLRPSFRRPFPDLFVPKAISVCKLNQPNKLATILDCSNGQQM